MTLIPMRWARCPHCLALQHGVRQSPSAHIRPCEICGARLRIQRCDEIGPQSNYYGGEEFRYTQKILGYARVEALSDPVSLFSLRLVWEPANGPARAETLRVTDLFASKSEG